MIFVLAVIGYPLAVTASIAAVILLERRERAAQDCRRQAFLDSIGTQR